MPRALASPEKDLTMKYWTQPSFEELTMNAEIGAYQPDPDDDREPPPVLAPSAEAEDYRAGSKLRTAQRATRYGV